MHNKLNSFFVFIIQICIFDMRIQKILIDVISVFIFFGNKKGNPKTLF